MNHNTGDDDKPDLKIQGGDRTLLKCHNFSCDFETFEKLPRCPECGRPLLDTQTLGVLGWLLVAVGGILALTGAGLLILAAPKMPRDDGAYILIYGIFGLVFAVGLTFVAAGLGQATSGNKSQTLIGLVLILWAAFTILGAFLRFLYP